MGRVSIMRFEFYEVKESVSYYYYCAFN
jgi:hypothetical protein